MSLFAIFKALEMADWTNQAVVEIAEKNHDPEFAKNFESRVVFQDEIHPSITHISNMALVHVGRSDRIDSSLPHLNPNKIKEAAYTFDVDATFDNDVVAKIISLAANIHSHGIEECKNFYVALTAKDGESMERCKIIQDILNSDQIAQTLPQNITVSPFILDIRQSHPYNHINLSENFKLAEIGNRVV